MTQQEGREETSCWMSASVGASPDSTGNLGPWSRRPAWGHTVTTTMATIPSMLTVPKVSAMNHAHCAYHLPVPLFPLRPPYTPPWILCTRRPAYSKAQTPPPSPSLLYPVSPYLQNPPCHAHQFTQHTYHAKQNMTSLPHQSCHAPHAHRTYCACSVVHLHRKHPCWLCRQRACVCQAIEQERLEGLPLREGERRDRGGGGTQRESWSDRRRETVKLRTREEWDMRVKQHTSKGQYVGTIRGVRIEVSFWVLIPTMKKLGKPKKHNIHRKLRWHA